MLMGEYAILVFLDWLLGRPGFGLPGYGLPGTPWTGTFVVVYVLEWVCWFIIPIITMLWWRAWAKKHPELLEEL
ncbi:MAG: hypothetical protein QXW27_00350 [Candidatus Methanomethylicaceae archaeon]